MEELRNYEIRVWDADQRLLYVAPTVGISEQEAQRKAAELLSLHGGDNFTLQPQLGAKLQF